MPYDGQPRKVLRLEEVQILLQLYVAFRQAKWLLVTRSILLASWTSRSSEHRSQKIESMILQMVSRLMAFLRRLATGEF
ncbi:hypothetical protein KCP78_11585 [Salmonella enterica subsp. enterica]|nr:hypothetical protein KCP78_11585 [Salmonella enterica subsp. enterica]